MRRITSATILVTTILALSVVVAWADSSQPRLERESFSASTAHGWIDYCGSYRRASQDDITNAHSPRPGRRFWLYLKVQKPAALWSLDYRDFKFDLQNSLGARIALAPPADLSGSVAPEVGYEGANGYAGFLRRDTTVDFLLDVLYPHLLPGAYTLKITLAPRDRAIPSVKLPAISFQVTPD